jgi:hypothetical protein
MVPPVEIGLLFLWLSFFTSVCLYVCYSVFIFPVTIEAHKPFFFFFRQLIVERKSMSGISVLSVFLSISLSNSVCLSLSLCLYFFLSLSLSLFLSVSFSLCLPFKIKTLSKLFSFSRQLIGEKRSTSGGTRS